MSESEGCGDQDSKIEKVEQVSTEVKVGGDGTSKKETNILKKYKTYVCMCLRVCLCVGACVCACMYVYECSVFIYLFLVCYSSQVNKQLLTGGTYIRCMFMLI